MSAKHTPGPLRGPLGYPLAHCHLGRHVYWGHWGIDFCEPQPDERLNFGIKAAHLPFGVGACGPVDGTFGSPTRLKLQAICDAWVQRGELPSGCRKVDGFCPQPDECVEFGCIAIAAARGQA